jgi:ATP synthase F1 delta subunit
METLTVSLTYSQALFDAARDVGKIDGIGKEYKAVSQIFADNPSLRKLFLVPTLSAQQKKEAARQIFENRISEELLNFLYILIDKRRIGVWDSIGKEYEKLVWERDGYSKGILYTAVPIDPKRHKALEEKTGSMFGKKVKLENRIDKSIIGGLMIFVEGKLIDASVRSRLDSMKQRMKQ